MKRLLLGLIITLVFSLVAISAVGANSDGTQYPTPSGCYQWTGEFFVWITCPFPPPPCQWRACEKAVY